MTTHNYREQDGCQNCEKCHVQYTYADGIEYKCLDVDAENEYVKPYKICDRHRRRDDE